MREGGCRGVYFGWSDRHQLHTFQCERHPLSRSPQHKIYTLLDHTTEVLRKPSRIHTYYHNNNITCSTRLSARNAAQVRDSSLACDLTGQQRTSGRHGLGGVWGRAVASGSNEICFNDSNETAATRGSHVQVGNSTAAGPRLRSSSSVVPRDGKIITPQRYRAVAARTTRRIYTRRAVVSREIGLGDS